nr:unnamed protein product [Callosobruchus chinensis]
MSNMIAFKRARAKARRDMLDSQRRSWREYVSTITPDSHSSEIWNKVKAIQGRQSNRHIEYLRTPDGLLHDPERIADTLAQHFAQDGKNPLDAASYRPISLTSCLSKLLERMVNERLSWLLEKDGRLHECQMGFRKGRSTTDQLVYLEDIVQKGFRDRKHTVAVFFDIEKATSDGADELAEERRLRS